METAAVQQLQPLRSSSQGISKSTELFSEQFSELPVKKMDELLNSQSPALCRVDRKGIELCVFTCIGDYLNFIGVESMKDNQILEVAQMMIDAHPHLPVDAIKTFFYECKRGSFGFHYNKMDGTKLLMWFDKFVSDYYKQLDDMEYEKHNQSKEGLAKPLEIEDEDGVTVDVMQLLASFRGKTVEEMERERKVKDIRFDVYKRNMNLYNSMPVEAADKAIEQLVIDEMKKQGLLTF
jgi:hypothetical protein